MGYVSDSVAKTAAGIGGTTALGLGLAPVTGGLSLALPLAGLLGNIFTSLWGTSKQNKANKDATNAQIAANKYATDAQTKAAQDALDYQKTMDARDYKDYLQREARDRTDWEAEQTRKAPYRALGDSAVRTLADYIRVPGMQPAQEVPVQHWTASPGQTDGAVIGNQPGTSNTMPVQQNPSGSVQSIYDAFAAGYKPGVPTDYQTSNDFVNAFSAYAKPLGYNVGIHPETTNTRPGAYDGLIVTDPNGRVTPVDYIANAGGANPTFAWQPDTGVVSGGASGASSQAAAYAPESLFSKYGKRTAPLPVQWG